MNTMTQHDRELAETLRSLRFEPMTHRAALPGKARRRIGLTVGAILLTSATVSTIVWPHLSGHVRALLHAAPAVPTPAVAASTAPVAVADRAPVSPMSAPSHREVTGSGYVVAPQSSLVFAKYEGQVTSVAVEAGDHVSAGQVLVKLDDTGAHFAREQAQAALNSAALVLAAKRIALDQAQSALRRKEALTGIVSRQDVDDTRTAWASAQNNVAQAREDLDKAALAVRIADEQVDALTVRAPIAGTVTRLGIHVGDRVLARVDSIRENQSLMAITDVTRLVIDADVAETRLASLRPGLRGEAVLDAFPDRPFAVEIEQLAPVVSSDKGTITLRLSPTAPPEGIRPGMAARIHVILKDQ